MDRILIENREKYFQVALVSSLVLFGFNGKEILIFIHKQSQDSSTGFRVLPSVYVSPDKSNECELRDFIKDRLHLDDVYLEQLKAFNHVYRNPVGRVVNIAYMTLIKIDEEIMSRSEEYSGAWVSCDSVPELAYDHNKIVNFARERLKRRVRRRPVGFNLLAEEFTLTELQVLYESVLGKEMDKRNFRKKIFKSELIVETGNKTTPEQARKPAKLYRFDKNKYQKMTLKGYDFLF